MGFEPHSYFYSALKLFDAIFETFPQYFMQGIENFFKQSLNSFFILHALLLVI